MGVVDKMTLLPVVLVKMAMAWMFVQAKNEVKSFNKRSVKSIWFDKSRQAICFNWCITKRLGIPYETKTPYSR